MKYDQKNTFIEEYEFNVIEESYFSVLFVFQERHCAYNLNNK